MKILDRMWDDPVLEAGPEDRFVIYWHDDWPVGSMIVPAGTVPDAIAQPDHAIAALATEAAHPRPEILDVSLVICTRDRPAPLAACLSGLRQQSAAPREIIVVDNASIGTATRDIVLASGATYLREDRPGLDYARNTGAMAARGAIVAYTDDDVVLHPRWLERIVAGFTTSEIGAVTGLVLPAELDTEAQRFFEFHWGFGRGFQPIQFGAAFFARDTTDCCPVWEIGAGANMAFRREALESIGYFDERLDVGRSGCSGDSEAWHRMLAAGHTCRYEPGAVAFHYHRREMADLARQIRAYMRGHSSSVLVQYGTTRGKGNLRRLLRILPKDYAYRLRDRLKNGKRAENALLWEEISGFLSGIAFIARHPRSPVKQRLRG